MTLRETAVSGGMSSNGSSSVITIRCPSPQKSWMYSELGPDAAYPTVTLVEMVVVVTVLLSLPVPTLDLAMLQLKSPMRSSS